MRIRYPGWRCLAGCLLSCAVAGHIRAAERMGLATCGFLSNGLEVRMESAQQEKFACPRAIAIAERYLLSRRKIQKGQVRIRAGGKIWICEEREAHANPLAQCVMHRRPTERVELVS